MKLETLISALRKAEKRSKMHRCFAHFYTRYEPKRKDDLIPRHNELEKKFEAQADKFAAAIIKRCNVRYARGWADAIAGLYETRNAEKVCKVLIGNHANYKGG